MPAMTEAEVYQYLTKDGDSLPAIKKNTEMLRQHFTIESQRVVHTLSQLDPHNSDRHEAEAQRIYQENNAALDRVLMQVASTTPQKLPLLIDTLNDASKKTQIPKNQAKAFLSLPLILFCAFPAALFYEVVLILLVGAIVVVAAIVNHFIFHLDTSSIVATAKEFDRWLIAKVVYGICYFFAVIIGFSHIRGGGTVGEAFNMLFLEPLVELLSVVGGGKK